MPFILWEQFLEAQKDLQNVVERRGLRPEEFSTRVIWNVMSINLELAELVEGLQIKPWRQTRPDVDWENILEEMADIMHFYLNLMIDLDISSEHLAEAYQKKWQTNMGRIVDRR